MRFQQKWSKCIFFEAKYHYVYIVFCTLRLCEKIWSVFLKPCRAWNINFWLPKAKKYPPGAIRTTFLKQQMEAFRENPRIPWIATFRIIAVANGFHYFREENHHMTFSRNTCIPCKILVILGAESAKKQPSAKFH